MSASEGDPVPSQTTGYDSATGLPATTTAQYPGGGVSVVTKAYDSLGRITSYTDADGNVSTVPALGRFTSPDPVLGTGTDEGLYTVIQIGFTGRFTAPTGYLTHGCSSDPTPNTIHYEPQLECCETIYGRLEVWVSVSYTYRGKHHKEVHHGELPIQATLECK